MISYKKQYSILILLLCLTIVYANFIFGTIIGTILHKKKNVKNISYDKYLVCPSITYYPFGEDKCYISNEKYIAYYLMHSLYYLNKLTWSIIAYMLTKYIYKNPISSDNFWFGITYGTIYSIICN